jgi:hypothetical protein
MAIIKFLSNPSNLAEVLVLATGIFTLANKRFGYWRLFLFYLSVTIAVEAMGFYLHFFLDKPNYQIYNIFLIVQAIFFSFLFSRFQETRKMKVAVLAGLAFFMLFLLGEQASILISTTPPKHHGYLWNTRIVLSVLVTVYAGFFYFSVLRSDSIRNPLKYPPFWIITGLFFYYFGSLPMFAFYEWVARIKLSGDLSFYSLVMGCLSCILYGTWIIGFIWRRKQIPFSRQ